jgi:CubicO group peptidase (beta-lactamase class C family)
MNRMLGGLICAVALLAACVVGAQPLPTAQPEDVGMSSARLHKIGPVFRAEIDAGRLPGAVIMIARKGRLVYAETYGFRDKQADAPLTRDAVFRIYSMTKPLVSVAAMMLMEDGRLQLTDPVSKFLPEFRSLQVSAPKSDAMGQPSYGLVAAERQPTIQDLLRHTAGFSYGELTGNTPVKQALGKGGLYNPDFDYNVRDLTPEEEVTRLSQVPLAYQPGATWEYSLATDVLGRVIEKVSGQRLGDFLQERLLTPLRMTDTGFSEPPEKQARIAQPLPIDPATGRPTRLIDPAIEPKNDSAGAGGFSTASDYLRFSQMLLNGGRLDGVQVLSPTTVALMTSDQLGPQIRRSVTPGEQLMGVPGYTFGLGFTIRQEAGLAGVPGSQGEFMWAGYAGTFFWVDPKQQLAAVMMMQAPGPSRIYYRKEIKQLVYQAIVE